MPGPGTQHGDIQLRLAALITPYLHAHHLGTLTGTGCYNLPMPDHSEELLCPDLSYVLPQRKATAPMRGSYLVLAPDMVIEIASPRDFRPQVQNKVQIYLAAGVHLVWVVWPHAQTVDVWRPTSLQAPIAIMADTDMLDGLDVMPGFACHVKDIFA